MLRINVTARADGPIIALEGRLVGPWVAELRTCWNQLRRAPGRPIRVELDGVSFIDAGGRALLDGMYADGVVLAATDVMMRAVVDEIAARAPRREP
jgi:hypothetical protein